MPGQIYRPKATIGITKPPVCWRLLIPATTALFEPCRLLQAALGWWTCPNAAERVIGK
ncbi:MAG: hypothetical protein ACRDZ5_05105 [Acidimicrobiales bacterium]